MNKALERKIRGSLAQALDETQLRRMQWAADSAKREGNIPSWFGSREWAVRRIGIHYWILGEREQAWHWFRERAQIILEWHDWTGVNEPEYFRQYPHSSYLEEHATALVQAGLAEDAKRLLHVAHRTELDRGEKMDHNHMLRIGLASAQVGYPDLVPSVQHYIDGQKAMLARSAAWRQQALSKILRHVWAQVSFLQGDFAACKSELERVFEAERITEEQMKPIWGFSFCQRLIFGMAHALMPVVQMCLDDGDRGQLFTEAEGLLWKAVSLSEQHELDYEIYLKRLYLYMAEDAYSGRTPHPCPFMECSL